LQSHNWLEPRWEEAVFRNSLNGAMNCASLLRNCALTYEAEPGVTLKFTTSSSITRDRQFLINARSVQASHGWGEAQSSPARATCVGKLYHRRRQPGAGYALATRNTCHPTLWRLGSLPYAVSRNCSGHFSYRTESSSPRAKIASRTPRGEAESRARAWSTVTHPKIFRHPCRPGARCAVLKHLSSSFKCRA
jgi:hypothetical protein